MLKTFAGIFKMRLSAISDPSEIKTMRRQVYKDVPYIYVKGAVGTQLIVLGQNRIEHTFFITKIALVFFTLILCFKRNLDFPYWIYKIDRFLALYFNPSLAVCLPKLNTTIRLMSLFSLTFDFKQKMVGTTSDKSKIVSFDI